MQSKFLSSFNVNWMKKVYIIPKTPALPFIGILVSATANDQHVPPMQTIGGVPPPQGYAACHLGHAA
jgi:hypothetical protein